MQVVKIRKINRIRKIFSVWIFVQIGFVFSANLGDIIITEFFYKSAGNNYEYIEIFNTTSDTINLMDWKIEIDGNEYSIDDSVKITSNDYIVLLSFSGIFQDSTGTTYCSSINPHPIFHNCNTPREDLYWPI